MKQLTILLAVFLMTNFAAISQRNTSPAKGISVSQRPIPNSNQFRTEVKITLMQTDGISKINLRMGSTRTGNDLYSRSFTFDQSAGTLSDGSTYSRTGNVISIVLPAMDKHDHFFGDVTIERSDASVSDPITFNR